MGKNPWMQRGRMKVHGRAVCIGALLVVGAACDSVDRARAELEWDGLNDERRAAVCWGRAGAEEGGGTGVEGVSREVLDKKCPTGESQPITRRQQFSAATESWLLETITGMAMTAEEMGLTAEDVDVLCSSYSAEDMAEAMKTDPSDFYVMAWNGVGYTMSEDMFQSIAEATFAGLCPGA